MGYKIFDLNGNLYVIESLDYSEDVQYFELIWQARYEHEAFGQTLGENGKRNKYLIRVDDFNFLTSNEILSSNKDFKLFPNSASDNLYVEILENIGDAINIRILNINGELVQSLQVSDIDTGIDISTLPLGMYIINIEGKTISSAKFIKI